MSFPFAFPLVRREDCCDADYHAPFIFVRRSEGPGAGSSGRGSRGGSGSPLSILGSGSPVSAGSPASSPNSPIVIPGYAEFAEYETMAGQGALEFPANAAFTQSGEAMAAAGSIAFPGSATFSESGEALAAAGTLAFPGTASFVESGEALVASGDVTLPSTSAGTFLRRRGWDTASWQAGFARNASEARYPELWKALVSAYAPALGFQGRQLVFNIMAGGTNGTWSDAFRNWAVGPYGWAVGSDSGSGNYLFTGLTSALNVGDFSAVGRYRNMGLGSTGYGMLKTNFSQQITSGGVWKSIVFSSTLSPIAISIANQWHSYATIRSGAVHTAIIDAENETSGAVATTTLGSDELHIPLGYLGAGYFSEMYFYGRALTRGEVELLHRVPLAPFVLRRR